MNKEPLPELERVKLPSGLTVESAIGRVQKALLPLEMQGELLDHVCEWGCGTRVVTGAVGPLVTPFLSLLNSIAAQVLPFYVQAAFAFGRRWKLSELAFKDVVGALDESRLKRSATELFEELAGTTAVPDDGYAPTRESLEEALSMLLRVGIQQQRDQLNEAKTLFYTWSTEVEPIVSLLERARTAALAGKLETASQHLIGVLVTSSTPSTLRAAMERSDPTWHASRDPATVPETVLALSYLMVQPESKLSATSIVEAVAVKQQIDGQRNKYGVSDPFEAYLPGGTKADEHLADLIREHTLRNGSLSPYLENWFTQLSPTLSAILMSGDVDGWSKGGKLLQLGRAADASIKKALTSSHRFRGPNDWNKHLKSIFERVCIHDLAQTMNRGKYEYSEFESIARTLLTYLASDLGYLLDSPSVDVLMDNWRAVGGAFRPVPVGV